MLMLTRADLKTGFSLTLQLSNDDDDDDDDEERERYCVTCRHKTMEVNEEHDDDNEDEVEEPNRRGRETSEEAEADDDVDCRMLSLLCENVVPILFDVAVS